jgi:hypothetical protein
MRHNRQAIDVVVRGTQTAPPVTGRYDIRALRLGGG